MKWFGNCKICSILSSLMLYGVLGWASVTLAAEGIWTKKADMPTARWGLCTSVVNGNIYAIGGMDVTGRPAFSTVEVYNPAADTWSRAASMPAGRVGLIASVANGRIYAIGGAPTDPFERALSTLQVYDPVSDTWTRKADMPTARAYLSASTVGGKVYAIGGTYATPWAGLSTVEVYDPATDTWTRKAPMPTGRWCLSTSVVGGRIYAIGGITGMSALFSTVEEYDPATDTWTRKADMPMPRGMLSTSVVDGKIHVIGGTMTGYPWPPSPLVQEYDPATDTWTRKADMPTARGAPSSVVNGKIYVIGGEITGWPNHGSRIVEEYDPNPLIVDFNGDGIVDIKDLLRLIRSWGTDDPMVDIAPPFGDGIVDALDLELLMSYWGQKVDDPTLVIHWALDEAQGAIAYDSAGQNDAFLFGGPVWQPDAGKIGGALALDGVNDYAFAQQGLNPAAGSFSVFAWIKGGAPGQVVVSQLNGANWLGADPAQGCLMTELCASGRGAGPLLSGMLITDGDWHRVGFTWDGSYRALYVDDILAADGTQHGLSSSTGGLNIGCGMDSAEGTFWTGLIDDIRIYNRAVSP